MAIGDRTVRREDQRLLTGRGRFSDDFNAADQLYAAVVRSQFPHAVLRGIDVSEARVLPGVVGVWTGADCVAANLEPIDHRPIPSTNYDLKLKPPAGRADAPIFVGPHHLLPTDKTRHVGEALAFVVATSAARALDAAERVRIDYDELPPVLDVAFSDAPPVSQAAVWDEVPDNLCVDTVFGDVGATTEAFANADLVVEEEFHVQRVTGVPLEPRAAVADYDPLTGHCTLYAGSGGAVRQWREVCQALGISEEELRVVSADVGGNFGTRNRVYVEFALVVWAARELRRSVKFVCGRTDAFLSDYQGRDLTIRVALAVRKDGRFLALRSENVSNVGSRVVSLSPLAKGSALVTGSYDIPVATVRSRAMFTTTAPTQAYRSSGRPEVTYAIERLVERAAAALSTDSKSLRRRNLVRVEAMPFTNPLGMIYDSGEYEHCLDRALEAADWCGFEARREATQHQGKLRGRGVAHYVESSTGAPVERAEIVVLPEGRIQVLTGTQPSGQGHQTSFAQVAAECLDVAHDVVDVILGDTGLIKVGGGSHSGRSMRMAGTVISMACETLIREGYERAAEALEARIDDLTYASGEFRISGTDRRISLFSLAVDGLRVSETNEMHRQVFPNGCHVCEVEVDPETGDVTIERYVAVDDVGRAINPMIVEGQTHGGVAQGVGQALREACAIDKDTGQPLTGSLMDYGLLRAFDLPSIDAIVHEVPSPTNPLGVKAGGEGGTTPALAVVTNAVLDALSPYGVEAITMPITSEKVWRAIEASKA